MLAGLLLDIIVVALLVIMIIIGVVQGVRGTALHILVATLVCIAGAAGIGYLTGEFIGPASGASRGIANVMEGIVGGDNFITDMLPWGSEQRVEIAVFVVWFLIGFFVSVIPVAVLMYLFGKLLRMLRKFTWFKIIDGVIAVVINVALYLVILLAILGFIHCFEGTVIMVNFREFLRSTYVTKFIYETDLNFFSGIFENLGIADIFVKVFG